MMIAPWIASDHTLNPGRRLIKYVMTAIMIKPMITPSTFPFHPVMLTPPRIQIAIAVIS